VVFEEVIDIELIYRRTRRGPRHTQKRTKEEQDPFFPTNNMSGVASWLTSIGLSQYADAFDSNGFDDLNVIKSGLSNEDLDAIGSK
jgi:hypothetical protein